MSTWAYVCAIKHAVLCLQADEMAAAAGAEEAMQRLLMLQLQQQQQLQPPLQPHAGEREHDIISACAFSSHHTYTSTPN